MQVELACLVWTHYWHKGQATPTTSTLLATHYPYKADLTPSINKKPTRLLMPTSTSLESKSKKWTMLLICALWFGEASFSSLSFSSAVTGGKSAPTPSTMFPNQSTTALEISQEEAVWRIWLWQLLITALLRTKPTFFTTYYRTAVWADSRLST